MQFEYQENIFDKSVPSLVIPVTEILKAKNFENDEKAWKEKLLLNKCISIYTNYCCGSPYFIKPRKHKCFLV